MRFKKSNIEKYIYCFLAVLPLAWCFCHTLFNPGTLVLNNYISILNETFASFYTFSFFNDFSNLLLGNLIPDTPLMLCCLNYFIYLVFLSVLDLSFVGFSGIIRIIRTCVDKFLDFGGNK